ncbi:MAG: ImmA/IrrE family metallo-endopeptidase [Clostridia bacterium]|nr:ImmA/IrrE family metallo-endopeptidase [Clostridia bacterium]
MALKLLLYGGVRTLPIAVGPLCRKIGVTAKLFTPEDENDGISIIVDGEPFVFVGETSSPERQRFTAAHELGHIVLDHLQQRIPRELNIEREASEFAAELIMPECILMALNVTTTQQIMDLCRVSYPAAFLALKALQNRTDPLTHLERAVLHQFHVEKRE